MKRALILLAIVCALSARAQKDSIKAGVYAWNSFKVEKQETRERRQILEGIGTDLQYIEMHATSLEPGKAPHPPHKHDDEEMIIIKEGQLTVTIEGKSKILSAGSVALMMPGDEHGFINSGNTKTTYYVMRYRSKAPVQTERAKTAGGSFMVDANDVVFKPHDKGGVRSYFEKPTGMAKRFEMHVTTLNAGLKSHDPHTHTAEEIVLMVKGNGNMQIANDHIPCSTGDVIFLRSGVLHAITNNSKEPITYFAFQFQ